MKKNIFLFLFVVFLILPVFSKSDVSILFGGTFERFDYVKNTQATHSAENNSLKLAVSNHNFFGKKQLFGFFEQFDLVFSENYAFNLFAGPSLNLEISDSSSFMISPFFHVFFREYEQEVLKENITFDKLTFGFGSDFRIKILDNYRFSPFFGCNIFFDTLYYNFEHKTDVIIYDIYKEYFGFGLCPYLGFSINF